MRIIIISLFALVSMMSCKGRNESRIHVVQEQAQGWYFILEKIANSKGESECGQSRLFLYPSSKMCQIRGEFGEAWGSDKFLMMSGVEIPSSPDAEKNVVSVRGRRNGFVEQGGKKIIFQAFYIGTEKEYLNKKEDYIDQLFLLLKKK